jgi:hypothetical protein
LKEKCRSAAPWWRVPTASGAVGAAGRRRGRAAVRAAPGRAVPHRAHVGSRSSTALGSPPSSSTR